MVWFIDVLRVMPARGIELAAFDLYKRLLSPLNQDYQKGDDAGWLATGLAGGAAGKLLSCISMSLLVGERSHICNVFALLWCISMECLRPW